MILTHSQAYDLAANLTAVLELSQTIFGVDAAACTYEFDADGGAILILPPKLG